MQRETSLEKACTRYVKGNGGIFIKLSGYVGIPDRMLLRYGQVIFIEFKDPKGIQSRAQKAWELLLISAGFQYHIIKSKEEFENVYENLATSG